MHMSESEHSAHLGLTQSKAEKLAEIADMKWKVISAIPLAVFSAFVMGWEISAQFGVVPEMSFVWKEFFHHLLPLMATYMLFVVGKPYLLGFYRFLRYGKANMDTLIGLGTSAAYLYSFIVTAFEESLRPFLNVDATYYDVTIIVIAFITLWEISRGAREGEDRRRDRETLESAGEGGARRPRWERNRDSNRPGCSRRAHYREAGREDTGGWRAH